jgi:predicted RNA-binding Zn-ribbon protein involved in translation (DUF1610 family)
MTTRTHTQKARRVHSCPVCGSIEFIETQTVTFNHTVRLPVTDDIYIETEILEYDEGDSLYLDYACAKCGTRPPIGEESFPVFELN